MHPNPAFRQEPQDRNLAFAAARGFGTLSVNGSSGPLMAHVPFLLSADGTHADIHLARSNAIARADVPCAAVLAIVGPDAYVSPDWYGIEDQVPTWNYVAVHLRGRLEPLPPDSLEPMVNALSDLFETRLLPKKVWTSDKMGPGVMDRMLRMIVPFRLKIETVEGTWKLSQNKPAGARAGVIAALEARGGQSGDAMLASLMRDLPE
jgi:transcriptional regulator